MSQKDFESRHLNGANDGRTSYVSMRAWAVIYPVFLYLAVCQIVNFCLRVLPFTAGWDAVWRQGADSLVGVLVLYGVFVRDHAYGSQDENKDSRRIFLTAVSRRSVIGMLCAVLMLGCASIALNNLIALTSLKELSGTYQAVEQAFYSSKLLWELLVLGVITPVAEEILYRYLVFYQLRGWLGRAAAIVGSALIFGLIHLNVVQTSYAFMLGLLLGILMEVYQDVRVAICGHMMANMLSLVRGETHFLSWLVLDSRWYLPVTDALVFLTAMMAIILIDRIKKSASDVK